MEHVDRLVAQLGHSVLLAEWHRRAAARHRAGSHLLEDLAADHAAHAEGLVRLLLGELAPDNDARLREAVDAACAAAESSCLAVPAGHEEPIEILAMICAALAAHGVVLDEYLPRATSRG